jgi:hypothetical protein
MPFAGYSNFDACVADQTKRGKSDESARKICGALQARAENKKSEELAALDQLDDSEVEVLSEGELFDVMQKYASEGDSEDIEITEAFITNDDTLVSSKDMLTDVSRKWLRGFDSDKLEKQITEVQKVTRELAQKTAEGTSQSQAEIGHTKFTSDLSGVRVVEPPYPPELMSVFLEVDETHFRCVKTKVTDAVGRDYQLVPTVIVEPDEKSLDKSSAAPKTSIEKVANIAGTRTKTQLSQTATQAEIDAEVEIVESFIQSANDVLGFEGVLERAAMDYEAIGWAAIEVIRGADMTVQRIAHIPAQRIRVLKGWQGFVEVVSDSPPGTEVVGSGSGSDQSVNALQRQFVYYQPFGSKVVSSRKNPLTGVAEEYDPRQDGDIDPAKLEWNLVDRVTGQPTSDATKAANELIWIPRHHSNTIYYGYSDVLSALGWLLANVHIRDFLLQYFEHNTIPRYAVIVEGAKLADPVKKTITEYFSTHIKGKPHKTLIIPIPALRGEVRVRFEKLDSDSQEGSFQETKKQNAQAIMTSHGVSPAIIGISEHSELGSGKGLSQAEIYKDRIVTPSQRYWQRKVNKLFRTGLGVQLIELKFDPLDIRDRQAESQVFKAYASAGALTINQVRKMAGLGGPLPGGDRSFILVGNQIFFLDEMTDAVSTDRQELQDEMDRMQQELAMTEAVAKVKDSASTSSPSGAGTGATPSSNGQVARQTPSR